MRLVKGLLLRFGIKMEVEREREREVSLSPTQFKQGS